MRTFYREILDTSTWEVVERVHKGWSKDKKYYIKTFDSRALLLRTAEISQYDKSLREYEAVRQLDTMDIIMSRPLDFGRCNNDQLV